MNNNNFPFFHGREGEESGEEGRDGLEERNDGGGEGARRVVKGERGGFFGGERRG